MGRNMGGTFGVKYFQVNHAALPGQEQSFTLLSVSHNAKFSTELTIEIGHINLQKLNTQEV